MAEQPLELSVETQQVEQRAARGEVHEQVDVAARALLPAGDRAEQPDPAAAVPGGNRLDIVAVPLHQGAQRCPARAAITLVTLGREASLSTSNPCPVSITALTRIAPRERARPLAGARN